MTHLVNGVMLLLSSSLALSIVAKATVIVMAGLAGVWLTRGSRAAVRHAVLAASFAVVLALPIATALVPPVRIAVPAEAQASAVPPGLRAIVDVTQPGASMNGSVSLTPAISHWPELSLSVLLLAGWFGGTAFFLLRMIMGLWQVHSLRRFGIPWRHGQSVVEKLALDAGIYRRVEVLLHESLPAPVTCGVFHPAIVLPPDAQNWDADDLKRAIIHELEHVRRCDWASHCLARIVRAVYWFHPLVWIAWRRLVLEAERSCDDAVVGRSEATAYADQLVGLARRLSSDRKSPALAMANRSDLSARVGAVLDNRMQRGKAGARLVAAACAVAIVVVLAMSPLIMIAAPQTTATPSTKNRLKFDVAAIRPCDPAGTGRSGPPAPNPPSHRSASNRTTFACFNLTGLIYSAYVSFAGGVSHRTYVPKIEGAPAWASTEHYNIEAKADSSPGWEMLRGPLLQSLLEDRFALRIHPEFREGRTYTLTVAKGGFKMQPFHDTCTPVDWTKHQLLRNLVSPETMQSACAMKSTGTGSNRANLTMDSPAMNLDMFAVWVAQAASLDGPVVNNTGIDGFFQFHVQFAVDRNSSGNSPDHPPPSSLDNPADAPYESVFTAVQQQLGLKLEATKGPREVLVIDHVEKPSEN